jgi:predicted nucleotidyltransferase
MEIDSVKISSIFRNHQVSFAYLFGSVAKERANKLSDVDVAVYFTDAVSSEQYLEQRLDLIAELSRIFKRTVDVLVLNKRCDELVLEVLKDGRIIFEDDAQARIRFRYWFTKQYLDFLPYRDYYFSKVIERIKTGKPCDERNQRHQESIEKIRRMHLHSEKHP